MNICLIGSSLTSLALAKNLINKKIKVFIYYKNYKLNKFNSRTIGISRNNLNFFNNEIIKIKKNKLWKINKIEIYNEKNKSEKILNFEKSQQELFSMVYYNKIYRLLENNLKKNKLFKAILIKNNSIYKKILKEKKHNLIINCDGNNKIAKDIFYKKIIKNYNSHSYVTVFTHKKTKNLKAIQIFTKIGPIAFLPISETETSVVFSILDSSKIINEVEVKSLITKFNPNYIIKKFSKIEKFQLNFSSLRNYHDNNLMSFGDSLHKIHPLAGQGFNMTLRDIKILSDIIQLRLDLGLPLDKTIYSEFEKKTKHLNFIFSNGIDFIYEFFKFDNRYENQYLDNFLKYLGKNKSFKNLTNKYADEGLIF